MTTLKTDTDSHRKAEQVLRQAGYRPLRQFQPTRGARSHKDELFEVWVSGEGKVIVVHFYGGSAGCCFYWPDGGLDWEQTAERLKDPVHGSRWRPMDEAPKDGTKILAISKATDGLALMDPLIVWWSDGKENNEPGDNETSVYAPGWSAGTHWQGNLTHWMPLPK